MEFKIECELESEVVLALDSLATEVTFIDFKEVESVNIITMVENEEVEDG